MQAVQAGEPANNVRGFVGLATNLFHVVRRGLVDFVDPVLEQQVGVAAPAVFRGGGGVAIGKQIGRKWRCQTGRNVTLIFVSQRSVVIFQMVQEMHGAVLVIAQHTDTNFGVVDQDFQIGPYCAAVYVIVARNRDHWAVGEAAQIGRASVDAKAYHPPKIGWSINISKSQMKSTQDPIKLNTKLHIHDTQLSYITLNNKTSRREHIIYKHMLGTKLTHAREQATFNVYI